MSPKTPTTYGYRPERPATPFGRDLAAITRNGKPALLLDRARDVDRMDTVTYLLSEPEAAELGRLLTAAPRIFAALSSLADRVNHVTAAGFANGMFEPEMAEARSAIRQAQAAPLATVTAPIAHGMEDGKTYCAHVTTTGAEILGTCERVSARSEIAHFFPTPGFDNTGVGYEHAGETKLFWDACETVTQAGRVVYLCENGEQWTADQLTFVELEA
jgi:hypothetical protein